MSKSPGGTDIFDRSFKKIIGSLSNKALGLKLKEAIEQGADRGRFNEENIVTLLERLACLVNHIGEGYRTTEVNEMLRNSAKGFGVVLLERRAAW
jgi:hypothetical protein